MTAPLCSPKHRVFAKLASVLALLDETTSRLGITVPELLRLEAHVLARRELYWRCRQLSPQPSYEEIADTIGVSKATVIYGVRRHMGAPQRYVPRSHELNPDFRAGKWCQSCGDLPHRATRPTCAKCGLAHESEPPLQATDYARIGSSFAMMLRPEVLPDLPTFGTGRRRT